MGFGFLWISSGVTYRFHQALVSVSTGESWQSKASCFLLLPKTHCLKRVAFSYLSAFLFQGQILGEKTKWILFMGERGKLPRDGIHRIQTCGRSKQILESFPQNLVIQAILFQVPWCSEKFLVSPVYKCISMLKAKSPKAGSTIQSSLKGKASVKGRKTHSSYVLYPSPPPPTINEIGALRWVERKEQG